MISTDPLIPIGQLGKTHGLAGEIRFRPYRPFFASLLIPLKPILVGTRQLTLSKTRTTHSHMLLSFEGVTSREGVQVHVNQELFFPLIAVQQVTQTPLQCPEQWVGWEAFSEGALLGMVVDILQTKANDIITIKGPAEEWLVPVIPEYILSINPDKKILIIKKPVYT